MLDEAILERLRAVRCFLLDMDGTFYLGDRLLEGSLDFLDALRKTGRQALFLTNNSSKASAAYVEKLRGMGVSDPFLRVYTSGQATGRYALAAHPGQRAYLLGNASLRRELNAMGVLLSDEEAISGEILPWRGISESAPGDDPDYVIVGFDTTLDYAKMTRVCDLVRAGLPYIATHPDFNCPTETGFIPDIGAIMAFIEASTGRKPDVIVGKPHRGIVDGALEITGEAAQACAMVGDRLYTDIATGVRFGMTAILVLSGEATRADIATSPVKPDLVFSGLGEMVPYLLA